MPKFENLENIEDTLYHRILRHSFSGAIKGALAGALIAVVAGAILGPVGVLIAGAHMGLGASIIAGIAAVSAVVVPMAAQLGGTAGIQSTRDGRRFMQFDRLPQLTPAQLQERQKIFELSHSVPSDRSFQDMLEKQNNQDISQITR